MIEVLKVYGKSGRIAGNVLLSTLNSTYNEKTFAEIFLHYRQLFIKGNVFIDEWEIFGAEVFLHYSQFFIIGDFIIDGVECKSVGKGSDSQLLLG